MTARPGITRSSKELDKDTAVFGCRKLSQLNEGTELSAPGFRADASVHEGEGLWSHTGVCLTGSKGTTMNGHGQLHLHLHHLTF